MAQGSDWASFANAAVWVFASYWLLRFSMDLRQRWIALLSGILTSVFVAAAHDPAVVDAMVDVLHPSLILTADATVGTLRNRCNRRMNCVAHVLLERGRKALPILLGALAVVGASFALGAISKKKSKTIGANGGFASVPATSLSRDFAAQNEEYRRFWDSVQPVKKPSTYHQTIKSLSVGTPLGVTTAREDFHRMLRVNVYRAHIVDKGVDVWGVKMSGGGREDMAMCLPAHSVGGGKWRKTAVRFSLSDDANTPRTAVVVSEASVVRAIPNDDFFVIRSGYGLPGGGVFKHYWAKKEFFC
jgi:hypothetical protein